MVFNKDCNDPSDKVTAKNRVDDKRKDVVINAQKTVIEKKTTLSDRNKKTNEDSAPTNKKLQDYFLDYWNSILSGYVYH